MMLEIKDISFTYSDTPVIEQVSFTIAKGQNAAIIGESGCGKSTLLKLIYGLYDLDCGSIKYNEKPILGPKHNLVPGEDFIKYLAQDFDLMRTSRSKKMWASSCRICILSKRKRAFKSY